jgi:hypothetical protein
MVDHDAEGFLDRIERGIVEPVDLLEPCPVVKAEPRNGSMRIPCDGRLVRNSSCRGGSAAGSTAAAVSAVASLRYGSATAGNADLLA